jgi:hypothetical protein
VGKLLPCNLKICRRLLANPRPVIGNVATASQAIKRAIEHRATLGEVATVEIGCVHLILNHVNSVTKRALEQREILVAAVVTATPKNLVVINLLFWDEITHGARMAPNIVIERLDYP